MAIWYRHYTLMTDPVLANKNSNNSKNYNTSDHYAMRTATSAATLLNIKGSIN
jgi:hypothetical protein